MSEILLDYLFRVRLGGEVGSARNRFSRLLAIPAEVGLAQPLPLAFHVRRKCPRKRLSQL